MASHQSRNPFHPLSWIHPGQKTSVSPSTFWIAFGFALCACWILTQAGAILALRAEGIERWKPLDDAGIFRSLLFGFRSHRELHGLLRGSGQVHLLALTGIYLYAFLGYGVSLGRQGLRSFGIFPYSGAAKLFLYATLTLGVLFLFILQEYRLGFLKPCLLFLLQRAIPLVGFRARRLAPLFFCLVIEGVFLVLHLGPDPRLEFFEKGRWLYALSVGGGVLALETVQGRGSVSGFRKGLLAHAAMAVGSWLPVAVLEIFERAPVAVMTPVLSLVTIPVISLGLAPLLLIDIISGFHFLSQGPLADVFRGFTWSVLESAQWIYRNGLVFAVPGYPAVFLGLGILIVVFLWGSRKQPFLIRSIFLVGLSLGVRFWNEASGNRLPLGTATEVVQVNVGQGDMALIRRGKFASLIDVGSLKKVTPTFLQSLRAREGISQIESVLITHEDEDHAGGLFSVMQMMSVRRVCRPGAKESLSACFGYEVLPPLQATVRERCERVLKFSRGLRERWTGLRADRRKANHGMPVVMVPVGRDALYVGMGDADQVEEVCRLEEILLRRRQYSKLFLKASHHGSKNSGHPGWFQTLRPTEVWISTGVHNSYGHPSLELLRNLGNQRVLHFSTDLEKEGRYRAPE